MNSNLIREGEYYAWFRSPPRGTTPLGAARVRITKVSKFRGYNKNRRTEVTFTIVEEGAVWPMTLNKVGTTKTVPAREIIDFWDSYKDETDVLMAERRAREDKRKLEKSKEEMRKVFIDVRLAEKGIPRGTAIISTHTVTMPLDAVLRWLGVSREEMEQALSNMFGTVPETSVPSFLDLSDNRDVG